MLFLVKVKQSSRKKKKKKKKKKTKTKKTKKKKKKSFPFLGGEEEKILLLFFLWGEERPLCPLMTLSKKRSIKKKKKNWKIHPDKALRYGAPSRESSLASSFLQSTTTTTTTRQKGGVGLKQGRRPVATRAPQNFKTRGARDRDDDDDGVRETSTSSSSAASTTTMMSIPGGTPEDPENARTGRNDGRPTYCPPSYGAMCMDAFGSVRDALNDGEKLLEVEFPAVPGGRCGL